MPSDVKIFVSKKVCDERGYVQFPFEKKLLKENGIDFTIVQINNGYSKKKHTIRGCHFQEKPHEQAKVVYCLSGCVYSVAVDIRKESSTFGLWRGEYLSPDNSKIMYIPKGFAHAYVTLSDNTLLQWCVDEAYQPLLAKSIKFDDPDISIDWPIELSNIIISDKDKNAIYLKDL